MAWTDRDIELAWAAGFFDGEWSIGSYRDRRGRGRQSLDMHLVQSGTESEPPESLVRFQAAVGGIGVVAKRNPDNGRLGNKPLWAWRLGNVDQVRQVIRLLIPHLTEKVDDVARAISLRAEYEGHLVDRQLFCKRGHDLAVTSYPNNKARRNCRSCNTQRMAEWRAAQKGG